LPSTFTSRACGAARAWRIRPRTALIRRVRSGPRWGLPLDPGGKGEDIAQVRFGVRGRFRICALPCSCCAVTIELSSTFEVPELDVVPALAIQQAMQPDLVTLAPTGFGSQASLFEVTFEGLARAAQASCQATRRLVVQRDSKPVSPDRLTLCRGISNFQCVDEQR